MSQKLPTIDVNNLRFYATMAREFQWQTDVIDFRVIEETLNQVASRYHLANKRIETLEEERRSLQDDAAALRKELVDMRARFAETCICPACKECL